MLVIKTKEVLSGIESSYRTELKQNLAGTVSSRNFIETRLHATQTGDLQTEQGTRKIYQSESNMDILFSKDPLGPDSTKDIP